MNFIGSRSIHECRSSGNENHASSSENHGFDLPATKLIPTEPSEITLSASNPVQSPSPAQVTSLRITKTPRDVRAKRNERKFTALLLLLHPLLYEVRLFSVRRTRASSRARVHVRVQRNNKDARHNEDLKAPRLGDNYREPTLQPSKGLNVKRYTFRHHYGSFYAQATRGSSPPLAPSPFTPGFRSIRRPSRAEGPSSRISHAAAGQQCRPRRLFADAGRASVIKYRFLDVE